MGPSPRALGFRMPAEWEEHAATWMAWPHDPLTWAAGIEEAEEAFLAMIEALYPGERVELLVHDGAQAERVQALLDKRGLTTLRAPGRPKETAEQAVPPHRAVRLHVVGHADAWVRDYGPTFLVDGEGGHLGAVDWTFNAWGGKYDALARDDRLGAVIARAAGAQRFRVEAIMEGGAIDVDGQGTVLTTEQCLLHENRNPHLGRAEIEALLHDHLGTDHVVWLGAGIQGDDTDGHIDDLTRFVAPGTVVTATEADRQDANHEALSTNLARLQAAHDARGRELIIHELPMPDPVLFQGERYPASYANLYIGNEAVLLPVYDDPADAQAEAVLEALLPDRAIIPIDARALVVGMGACHCLTQQQPLV